MPQRQTLSIDEPRTLNVRNSFHRRMTWDCNLPDDVVEALWKSPDRLLRQCECLQTKARTTVVRVRFPSGSYLLKFHHWASFGKTLLKSRSASPNRLSFDLGVQLADIGLPTPRPLACVDVRLGPLNTCSYLLTEFVEGTSLYRTLRYDQPDAAATESFARQVAEIWQLLDEIKLTHNDLKPENFMIDRHDRVWLIDLENALWHKDRKSLRQSQREDVQRLLHMRSWQAIPQAAEQFRQRLWETPAMQDAVAEVDSSAHPLELLSDIVDDPSRRLTVLILCIDELHTIDDIRGCVESVRDFADEILVALANPDDGARELAERIAGCRAIQLDGFDANAERSAIAEASHPWVLVVEPAERVSTDLAKEIQFLLAGSPNESGFRIERRHYIFGHSIRFGDSVGDMPVRLVRRDGDVLPDSGSMKGEQVPKEIGKLNCKIYRHRAWNVEEWLSSLNRHAVDAARESQLAGERASLMRTVFHAPLSFLHAYFVKLGCLDGRAGLHEAIASAMFVYIKHAKLWQMEHGHLRPDAQIAETPHLKLLDPETSVPIEQRRSVPEPVVRGRRKAA